MMNTFKKCSPSFIDDKNEKVNTVNTFSQVHTDTQKSTKTVNVSPLRSFALKNLPPTSPLRDVLLNEREELTSQEFLAKLDIWLLLLRKEEREL